MLSFFTAVKMAGAAVAALVAISLAPMIAGTIARAKQHTAGRDADRVPDFAQQPNGHVRLSHVRPGALRSCVAGAQAVKAGDRRIGSQQSARAG